MTTLTDRETGYLGRVFGRINDLDSHEMTPTRLWPEVFGETGRILAPIEEARSAVGDVERRGVNTHIYDQEDDGPITMEAVSNIKGPAAPGAFNMDQRMKVLDFSGVDRQLLFPDFGSFGIFLAAADDDIVRELAGSIGGHDRATLARSVIDAHNEWAREQQARRGARLRFVTVLWGNTIDEMMDRGRRLIDDGARAIWISTSVPPAGLSPADPAMDAFWSMCEEADVPVVLHISTEFSFPRSRVWNKTKEFVPEAHSSVEFPLDPHSATTFHLAIENFLVTMVFGGVFERHPRLRFGVIEAGAQWYGPFAERLDLWSHQFRYRLQHLPLKASEYLARHVRVTPWYFEPAAQYLATYPHLAASYCYSSDYAHVEGGKGTLQRHAEAITPLGFEVFEQFFVSNAEWLLPA